MLVNKGRGIAFLNGLLEGLRSPFIAVALPDIKIEIEEKLPQLPDDPFAIDAENIRGDWARALGHLESNEKTH